MTGVSCSRPTVECQAALLSRGLETWCLPCPDVMADRSRAGPVSQRGPWRTNHRELRVTGPTLGLGRVLARAVMTRWPVMTRWGATRRRLAVSGRATGPLRINIALR